MNIRSIDLQGMIPRSTEASKVQQQHDHQPIVQQQQASEQLQHLAAIRQQQVQEMEKTEKKKVDRDNKKDPKEQREHAHKRSFTTTSEQKEQIADPVRGKNIDIMT
ncbi:hypothetical protein EV210_101328 [Anaerospora hongkongensis]|uniref:Uncharacterized protein n=1 Tax=Anaerospora hongkongensis TaxID=244830 RepID=A0A4R1Q2T5_9FIRM|nr:hypothetical protein [Anaerospora hongkongensis]TCL40127.1 hypothetical protein EV210_101328 [Anaerospora hongkongensis]